jgi:cob(I)alamin adenosyltransferase
LVVDGLAVVVAGVTGLKAAAPVARATVRREERGAMVGE